jgi:hypothetical protein
VAEKKHPVIKRDETIRSVLIGVVVVAAVFAILLSDKPLGLTNRPWVDPIAEIPARADLPEVKRFIQNWAYFVPKANHTPLFAVLDRRPRKAEGEPKPMLGYSIREVTAAGLPMLSYKELGYVLYLEREGNFQMVPLDESGLNLLASKTGTHLETGYFFPFWNHFWGLLFLVALGGIGLFELGALRRRREALDLI